MMLEYYIWLNELKGVQMKDKRMLIEYFKNPKNIYEASRLDLPEEYKDNENIAKALNNKDLRESQKILEESQRNNIKVLTIDDPRYRAEAKFFEKSPLVLYYKGRIRSKSKNIAVVGTRKATEYGIKVVEIVCAEYIKANFIIISGLAIGIDSVAHQTAIKMDGITYSFVAGGLNICYPKENLNLMTEIENRGAVISPYPVGIPPRKHHFIRRNEIMGYWSDEVIVVEGGKGSGAVKTGELALMNGKKVYAVPNNIFVNSSEGCNELLAKGAIPYTCKSDTISNQSKRGNVNKLGKLILEKLKVIPLSTQELSDTLNYDSEKIQKELLMLELEGYVRFQPDGRWHFIGW